jgi:ferredoxin
METSNPQRTISGLTIEIDESMCIGSGNCVNVAPEIFVIGEDNIVAFKDETPDIDQNRLIESCSVCPVDALIAKDDGEQIVP